MKSGKLFLATMCCCLLGTMSVFAAESDGAKNYIAEFA